MLKKWLILLLGSFLVLIVPAIGLFNTISAQQGAPEASDGRLDLSGWDYASRGAVSLSGEWEFYPGVLLGPGDFSGTEAGRTILRVPSAWNRAMPGGAIGIGTYRLVVELGRETNEDYGLRVANVRMASRTYLNGEEIGSSGVPAATPEAGIQANLPYTGFTRLYGSQAELIVQAANFSYASGGIVDTIDFGPENVILREEQSDWIRDFVVLCGFLLPGLLFLLLYVLHKRELPQLFLGLFCMLAVLYILTHGEKMIGFLLPELPYAAVMKLQAVSANLIYLMLVAYMYVLMPGTVHRTMLRAYAVLSFGGAFAALVLPMAIFSHVEATLFTAALISIAYTMLVTFRWVSRQPEDANLVGLGLLAISMFILMMVIGQVTGLDISRLAIYELVLFVLAQTVLIIRRFVRAFADVERLSKRLLTLDGLKDEFMADTSHELRTPLHGIINIARSMLEGAAGPASSKQKENLAIIMTTGQRLSRLVDDLLDFSRLKEGRIRLAARPLYLSSVVQSVMEVVAYTLDGKPISVRQECPDDLPCVRMDEDRLRQILYNLLGNAVKYTERGEICVRASASGDWVTVEVSDTGVGIERKRWPDIFRRFERAEETEGLRGAGLGLSITRELVELGGGRIWLESEPGAGTTFFFTLPISAETPDSGEEDRLVRAGSGLEAQSVIPDPLDRFRSPRARPETSAFSGLSGRSETAEASGTTGADQPDEAAAPVGDAGRILIVDDDPVNRRVLLNLLATVGCDVSAVSGGAEALAFLDVHPDIELVVTDWMMPGMSGLELSRELRSRRSLAELPILLLTARGLPEDVRAGFDAGASDFLGKPVDAGELRARVRTLIGMRRAAEEAVRTEMAFLQAQIKPHFLYNALNVIIATCPVDPDKATELLIELSQYLRGSFDFRNRDHLVPLHKELELVHSYIALEQARFEERLSFVCETDDLVGVFVPPLSIQPLVENAVRHGIMQRAAGGVVRLEIRDNGRSVSVRVEDNGVGLGPEAFGEIMAGRRGGVGLRNIHRRLSALHGASLHLEERPAGREGTAIGFELPKDAGL
ncbi:hybrid sensor histidine kinase/response regulator [Saccharibacillus brassicae]|uniref:histidine kinase n=1 Tax=Saccharibacillus brassicae TaxID=2583377 RepID=A0A4Y6UTK8_SACBS|nr:ATP-binding protein [Saccharibacillus brassicae]QDH21022.1 response regulator [Saccharibacillus brassicae]